MSYGRGVSKELSPLVLAAHAMAAVPGLQIVGVYGPFNDDGSMVSQGVVDDKGNRWIVSAPLTDAAGADVQAQTMLLHILSRARETNHLPFDVPVPVVNVRPNKSMRVLVHSEIGGRPGSWEEMAASPILVSSMARAVAALHELPSAVIERTGMPVYSAVETRDRLLSLLDEAAAAWTIPPNLYERWEAALEDVALFRFLSVPVHGDLGPDTFLCSSGVVKAMSSFASAHLGDPAEDLGWILAGDENLQNSFFQTYQSARTGIADLHLLTRARLYSEMALARWLLHGVRTKDNEVINDAKLMLKELAVAVGDSPLTDSKAFAEEDYEPEDLGEVNEALPFTEEVDPNAPTVNLSEILGNDDYYDFDRQDDYRE